MNSYYKELLFCGKTKFLNTVNKKIIEIIVDKSLVTYY